MKKFFSRFRLNAPVTLGFVAICGIALLLDRLTGGSSTANVFCTYRSSLLNPMTYVRAVGYSFAGSFGRRKIRQQDVNGNDADYDCRDGNHSCHLLPGHRPSRCERHRFHADHPFVHFECEERRDPDHICHHLHHLHRRADCGFLPTGQRFPARPHRRRCLRRRSRSVLRRT